MFKLLKWIIITMVVASIWYSYNFFSNLKQGEITEIKKDMVESINSGEPQVVTESIAKKIKVDLVNKKDRAVKTLYEKIKGTINSMFSE